ncbi:MAG: VOC family protein [Gammaproteobacteria bacterium]|nr:VOC family protein [Gammaproteobacteria bacterium]MBU1507455.1 VOC family protein [Gammaproteobacteria bacterium]MBU2119180.1 VOC family protein [Gammaproteobacteria bacterium]MBU2173339.1 VOC family protein [Gammaproteobacteria bacterium]MBU2202388.1 VOC family protein [Gammaproteobacteria bacterium]
MAHALNWFEIPVADFSRAKGFYEKVLGITIEPMAMGPTLMGMLSSDSSAVGGAIVQGEGGVPSQNGTMVYLNGGDDLAPMLARVEQAGGAVVVPKTEIGNDFGFFAHFVDTEGNKVGLHSMK